MTKTEVRPETIDLKALFSRMNALGFPKDFVSSTLLPSWWCEEFEQTKGAVVEAAAYISLVSLFIRGDNRWRKRCKTRMHTKSGSR